MKKLKKFISVLLTLVIASSMLCPIHAEQTESDYSLAIDVVSQLEIFVNEDFMPKKNITRAETAAVITRLMGYQYEELPRGESAYYDVSEASWAMPYINMLSQNGIMVGDENGYFMPEQNVTLYQMVKILMSIAGYGRIAASNGGYPNGYLRAASEQRLLRGIPQKGDTALTREEVAQLIYNALELEVVFFQEGEDQSMRYDTDGTTLMERYLKLHKTEGIIKANSYTRTVGEGDAEKGTVEINGVTYGIGSTDADEYLGYHVEAYYQDEDDTYLLAVLPKDNEIFEITDDDYISYEDHAFTYETGKSRSKRIKADETADVILNGVYKENPQEYYFDLKDGKFILIDNDRDGRVDVIKIWYSITYLSDQVGEGSLLIHDLYGQPSIDYKDLLDKDCEVTIRMEDAEIDPLQIEKYDVLDVYPSELRKNESGAIVPDLEKSELIAIDVTRNTVSGKVSSIGEDGIFVDGAEYQLTASYQEAIKLGKTAPLSSGDEKLFVLNAYGRIAGVSEESTQSGETYLYVTRYYSDEENLEDLEDGESTLQLRAYNASTGEWKRYSCRNKVKLNGVKSQKARAIVEAFTYNPNKKSFGSEFVPQLARVRFDENGEISFIDTAYVNPDAEKAKDSLSLDLSGSMGYKRYTLNSDVVIPNGTVTILRIPVEGNIADRKVAIASDMESEYRRSSWPPFSPDRNYQIDAFNLTDAMSTDLILYYEQAERYDLSLGYYTTYIMVTKVTEGINEDDEIIYQIHGYADGIPVSYEVLPECTADPSTLKKGDIIFANKPGDGIASFKQVLDVDNIQISEGKGAKKNLFMADNNGVGKAYAVVDRCIRVYFDELPSDRNFEANTASCNLGDNSFIMYDTKKDEFTSIYPEDIKTYVKTGSDSLSDYVYMYSTSEGFKGMFVIRK